MNQPRPLGDALDALFRHLGAPPTSAFTSLHEHWVDIVGPVMSPHCQPIDLIEGVLTIACDEGPWASQLAWMEHQIRQACASLAAGLVVKRVQVRVRR